MIYLIVNAIFSALHAIHAINVDDFFNRLQLAQLMVVENFLLTPLVKIKTLTNDNLKKKR